MLAKTELTYTVSIYMAGDIAQAKQACREFCERGLCVHIHPADYIYTGGEETGFKIGLVNYPRFPSAPETLWATAEELAQALILRLFQHSALLVAPDNTAWLTRRALENRGEPA